MRKIVLSLAFIAFALLMPAAFANPFTYEWQELGPGVWAAIRPEPFDLPQEGNAVFVVTSDGVVLFDAGGSPLMGESIVAKVRSVTDKPITHVVISHWHGDHMRGLQSIQSAFPKVTIYSHPFARDFIAANQEKWLNRRVNMVPNIRKRVGAALAKDVDMQGRPLIPAEKALLERGLSSADQLDTENNRTAFVVPNATFSDRLTLHLGGREIDFIHPGNSHTAGDIIMWLPQEKIVATGDIVNAPIPLMPSPYTNEYPAVLEKIEALGFKTLVPGHGPVEHDTAYVDLLRDAFRSVSTQMKALLAKGLSKEDAIAKVDLSAIEERFTHGDPFLKNRFHDYVAIALPMATYLMESGAGMTESF